MPVVMPNGTIAEPTHLAVLTSEQRGDLRLWHGRTTLVERVRAMRGYTWLTAAALIGGIVGFVAGVEEGIPPFVLAPAVSLYMSYKWWRRGQSLRESGLRLRRVILSPRLKWVLPRPATPPTTQQLEKLAPREVLDSPLGMSIRRAVEERSAILAIAASLSKSDRAVIPDLEATVNGLVERVVSVAQLLHRLDQSMDPRLAADLDARIAEAARDGDSAEGQRRLSLLRRQRDTIEELTQRRAALARQLDSAGLALGNLRLDLIKLRSSGLQSALSDVSSATQEARALSREIGAVLEAVSEVKKL
ncbi:MAG: hypothetical protein HOQ26_09660 [Gemmatimonadaceae bacterium]|nr:hypothetical protein [Gemmatimonadaceae bacterium]NUQ93156.1 hypothetical protein [Gemmatimonadaceae bacterium]